MSAAQLDACFLATPIVLDLDGNGIQTRAAANGVAFDLMGTGTRSQWGWAGGGDGLLVRDVNGDGVINDGTELFGTATQNAHGQRAGNGYAAMALEDTNHDGKLNSSDARWNELKVWVDANHDGKTDAGELKGLIDFGIVELDLNAAKGSVVDNGNLLGLVSTYTKADGSRHAMADVWFAKDEEKNVERPDLKDLLAAPSADLLAGSPAAPAAAQARLEQEPTAMLINRRLVQDDEQYRQNMVI